jgi:FtsP/CotA-like multicopper oxidase with cupredoxin domain
MLRVGAIGAAALFAVSASAQIPFVTDPVYPNPNAISATQQPLGPANMAFPLQNAQGPSTNNYQVNYPYPGQCLADPLNQGLFPQLGACPPANSFACAAPGIANQSAGGWAACGTPFGFKILQPALPPANKFVWGFLNPPNYTPDKASYPGADYYEIGLHESWGFQALADLGVFPNPVAGLTAQDPAVGAAVCAAVGAACSNSGIVVPGLIPGTPAGCVCNQAVPTNTTVPNGMQWTGLTCNPLAPATSCTCPAGLDPIFAGKYCPGGVIPAGNALFTPIFGVGQKNMGGTLGLTLAATPSPWSQNQYIATWPSISIRATKGTPVVVKWVNEFPNNHVLCTHPDAADWPCSIDRTFMGVKAKIDPATAFVGMVPPEGVNQYGSPQQPDNSWVTHLHGGDIPPSTDGFAEKWFGNAVTGPLYTPAGGKLVNPPFENPSAIELKRPSGNADTYTYPMIQEEATIWFHDHTLGKTHHNVIAGPAGFFPVKDPAKHGGVLNGVANGVCPTGYPGCTADYTWLDPLTELTGAFGIPAYDMFMAVQDRDFNDDGSINFSNGLGQVNPLPIAGTAACAALGPAGVCAPNGSTPVTPGVNPLVHPVWVPEYFGGMSVINGVLWPNKATEPGWYRLRIVDGSDSRCYTFGFQAMAAGAAPPAPGAAVTFNTPFYVIANDQGYLKSPVLAPRNRLTMCPGERYELLVNFGALPGIAVGAAADVYMVNNAPAPFPVGITPQAAASPFADMNLLMKFSVNPLNGPGVKSCGQTVRVGRVNQPIAPAALAWDPLQSTSLLPPAPGAPASINTAKGAWASAPGNYSNICVPANPALVADPGFVDLRPLVTTAGQAQLVPFPAGTIVRQVFLNEKVDNVTLAPLGMQLNGVPFEYKVTETPKNGSREVWQFVNLTVDAHPMHPHLVKHQIVARQRFNVGAYKTALCGGTTCMPGPAPGGEMGVIPDVNKPGAGVGTFAFLQGLPTAVTAASVEGGYKDASQVPPAFVTTIVANWKGAWPTTGGVNPAPGTAGATCVPNPAAAVACPGTPFIYEPVTSGPYVWHCHINSHEDSEMMRTSLVVP